MNDDEQLDPLERLRAADPAAGLEARDGFADEVVATGRPTPRRHGDAGKRVTGLGAERARRRPTWLQLAAVAASLLVVGAAGYGIGATTGGATNLADGAAPPVSLQSGRGPKARMPGGAERADAGAAAGRQKMSGLRRADMMFPYGVRPQSLQRVGPLDVGGRRRGVWVRCARGIERRDRRRARRRRSGSRGRPSWRMAPGRRTAGRHRPGALGVARRHPRLLVLGPAGSIRGSAPTSPTMTEPASSRARREIPSEEAAIDALRSLIASTGRDPGAYEYTSETWEGAVTRIGPGLARHRRAAHRPGVDAGALERRACSAPPVRWPKSCHSATTPVVSEQEAFDRLSDPRFGAQMTNLPIAMRDAPASLRGVGAADGAAGRRRAPGAALSWPVNQVEIVDARLGLASQWQPDGSVLVVPAYEFTDAGGGTWSVIAVADSMLDFATE